jgi:integrase
MQTETAAQHLPTKNLVYRTFISFLGTDVYADSVTKKDIEAFLHERLENGIEGRPVGTKTVNRYLRDLKALYNWAIGQDIGIFRNPCRGIEKFPESPSVRYIPPAEDVDKVMMAADREQMDLLMVVYHTLGRISEVLHLKWGDVNFENQWVRLYTRKRRGGELQEDYLPMNDTLHEVLHRRWKNRDKTAPFVFPDPLTGEASRYDCKMMPRLCKKAGVKEFGFHAIRHHVASVLNDSGKASMKQIQQLLRHKRQSTTEGYLHSIGQDLRDATRLLEGKGRGKEPVRLVMGSELGASQRPSFILSE